jgi:hypothetical protein
MFSAGLPLGYKAPWHNSKTVPALIPELKANVIPSQKK